MSAAESSKAWSTIASLAALGTGRASQPLDAFFPDASVAMPGDTAESTLLRVAAATYLWQVAGSRAAVSTVTPPEIAPPVEDSLVSEVAAWRLGRMLNGDHRELLPEWLALAARAGRVLPPHWVPVALDGLKGPERLGLAPVLGQRGRWLAARNPAWRVRDTTAAPSEERWSNGTLAERVAELEALRSIDAAAARGWVEKTWEVDPPEAREAFVRALLDRVGAEDEQFLETALRDKRKAVRVAALEGLARLPTSAHALRNIERVEPLLTFDPPATGLLGKLKKRRLHVELPAALDKAAARDGIEATAPASRKIGERAWWLVQMVSLVPPSHWTARFDCDAPTLIEAVADSEYKSELLSALTEAATRHADEPWLTALLRYFLAQGTEDGAERIVVELVGAAPPASREKMIALAFEAIDGESFYLALALPAAANVDWSAETTRRAFELLGQRVRSASPQASHPRNTLTEWALRAHIETAVLEMERLDARCPDPSPWRNAVEALKDIIEFRAAMKQELLT